MATLRREIVQHPVSGERFILETRETEGRTVYRAAGPIHNDDWLSDVEMRDWLDNQPDEDVYEDGDWLASELWVREA